MSIQKQKKAVIFGSGSFAEIVYYYLTHDSLYDVAAFTVSQEHLDKDNLFDLPILPFEEIEKQYPPEQYEMYIAVGYTKVNKIREDFYHKAKEKGYRLLTYISSNATLLSKNIGDNCFILEDNTIQPFVHIGNNVVCWSGNHIGHHSIIEDHCYITSHVVISGHCTIKKRTFIGVNATLRDKIVIAEDNVIGAGAVILKNTQPMQVFAVKTTDLFARSSDKLSKL